MNMKKFGIYVSLFLSVFSIGCTDEDVAEVSSTTADARELTGIRPVIEGSSPVTRAGVVTTLADYVGRSDFKSGDKIVFTEIRRTTTPLDNFTYPGKGYYKKEGNSTTLTEYEGITFVAGSEGGWTRDEGVGPERVYWTDATNPHTFIAYSIPQSYGEYWKPYKFTQGEGDNAVKKTYYVGAIGNPTLHGLNDAGEGVTTAADIIDYTLTAAEQAAHIDTVNNVIYYRNPKLEHEDVVIAYDTKMLAEPGGSVALVKFYHALSSIRVVVNISGFAASSSATDTSTVVSNMRLLHQPTMYIWMQAGWGAQPLRATARPGETKTDQEIVNAAWGDNDPAYNQRKDIKLWIPQPKGSGTGQSKTFTFYGITTPQPSDYVGTLTSDTDSPYKTVELVFDVTYPNPMKPGTTVTQPYKATLPYGALYHDDNPGTDDTGVHFEAGHNTTINITLNHKNEKMTVGVEYENWQFVATPDVGELKKNSTFLQGTAHDGVNVTILGDEKATIDDATWLYQLTDENGKTTTYDIYGHKGTEEDPYQISTANQLLSFAYEVKSGRDFTGKFVRLDADLTLQESASKTKPETEDGSGSDPISWIGIGTADHPFNGTFIGGYRYIHRLYGSPLFASLGPNAEVKQLNVDALSINNGVATIQTAVLGGGLFAETNAGRISGCRVVGDVTLSGETSGAFVGSNTGALYASYHVGDTKGTTNTGGLVGTNSGIIACCFQAGKVVGTSTQKGIAAINSVSATIYGTYFNNSLFTYTDISTGVTGKSSSDMIKLTFVETLNGNINTWLTNYSDYDEYVYIHQPANYPSLKDNE